MRHDPDFVKALYLGVDLLLRYVIPCITLAIVNIRLVLAVRRAHIQHAEITGAARVSLFKLPILKTVAAIVLVFLICHTGGSAIFIMDIARTFASTVSVGTYSNNNILLDATVHTNVLVFKILGLLLAALNSSINVLVYCVFLPVFRSHWRRSYWDQTEKKTDNGRNELTPPEVVPWEEMQQIEESNANTGIRKVVYLPVLMECLNLFLTCMNKSGMSISATTEASSLSGHVLKVLRILNNLYNSGLLTVELRTFSNFVEKYTHMHIGTWN